jgi:hypothetical protein
LTRAIDIARPTTANGSKLLWSRPDRHVAWRDDTLPSDPLALIDRVRSGWHAG